MESCTYRLNTVRFAVSYVGGLDYFEHLECEVEIDTYLVGSELYDVKIRMNTLCLCVYGREELNPTPPAVLTHVHRLHYPKTVQSNN